jgi:hypothetical protein
MSTAIQAIPQQPKAIQEWQAPSQIKARIQAIQQLMETTLKKDVDYGVIPGMPKNTKPSLWKPGSEQILAMFQIAVEPIVEDLSEEDCYRYRVTARLTNSKTGEFLGAGIGEASTNETKYKWRRTYSKAEFDNTPADRKRMKFGRYNDGSKWVDTEEMQVRQEPADLANTILKMAKKRAQIDATLTVTGASSMFEQDLEDLTDETREEMSRQRVPRGKKTPPKETGDVMCAECRAINGHLPSCSHRQKDGPQPTQTQEPEKKPESLKWLVQVEAVDKRTRKEDHKGKTVERVYRILTCINQANENITLYAWHESMFERLDAIKTHTRCVFIVKPQVSGEKTYYSVDSIVDITGEPKPPQEDMFPPEDAS